MGNTMNMPFVKRCLHMKAGILKFCLSFLLVSTFFSFGTSAFAYSGSDYTTDPGLASKLDAVLNGTAWIFDGETRGYAVGEDFGDKKFFVDGWYGWSCCIYANGVYHYLFGEVPSRDRGNSDNSDISYCYTSSVSYDYLHNMGIECGAFVALTNHYLIILKYDQNNITFLQTNNPDNNKPATIVNLTTLSWYDFNRYIAKYWNGQSQGQVEYIVYPNNIPPVINRAIITNKSSSGYDVTVTATCASGLKEIGCYTWHSAMSLDDAKKLYAVPINGTATFHVNYSTFGNPQNVQYYTNVEAFNTQGKGVIKPAVEVVEDLGNDFYATIKQDSSGGYLQCSGSKIVTGLLPESASDTKNAVWHFRKQLDGDYIGSYEISSEGNGGCIDIESYGVADGNGINLLEAVGNLAQRFYICRDRQKGYDRYFFNSVLAMSSLDVPGEYTDLGGTIQLWTTNYTDAQMFLIQSPDWTIEYDANGGAGAPASQTKHYRTPVSIPTTVPSRAYYSFLGWAERATASVAAYAPGDTYSQEGNKTLYAVWERIEADILELPADLEVIGDGAFLQTDADIIVVPESVTQIGENAFGDVVIYGYEGSAAESYAHSNGLTFVPLS